MSSGMLIGLLIGIMLLLFLLKVPIYLSMPMAGVIVMLINDSMKWGTVAMKMHVGIDTFTLLAIPMFLMAAKIMNTGGITRRLFAFCNSLVGWLPGGLGHVNVLASVVFAGMSGTAVSDAGGLGSIEIEAMTEHGFDKEFSVAVTAASSTLGPIIPPSIPMVVYATVAGASVGALFMAGIFAGVVMAAIMMIVVAIYSVRRKYPRGKFPTFSSFFKALREGILPIMAPVILLYGIYTGKFTPTESAVIVVIYSLLLSGVVYREITFKDIIRIMRETVRDSCTIAMLIAGATLFGYVAVRLQLPQKLLTIMTSVVSSKWLLLIILNVFLLIIGCFLETASAITILVPLILPLLQAFQVSEVQFGVIMVLNLMIGLLTPPFGLVLFVLARVSGLSIGRLSVVLLPWIAALLLALIIVTFCPAVTMWLPTALGMMG